MGQEKEVLKKEEEEGGVRKANKERDRILLYSGQVVVSTGSGDTTLQGGMC
jgi:hypothetical protein